MELVQEADAVAEALQEEAAVDPKNCSGNDLKIYRKCSNKGSGDSNHEKTKCQPEKCTIKK